MLSGWNAAVPNVCDVEAGDLVSGLPSTCWLLGHSSLGKLWPWRPCLGNSGVCLERCGCIVSYLHANIEADTALVFVGLSTP